MKITKLTKEQTYKFASATRAQQLAWLFVNDEAARASTGDELAEVLRCGRTYLSKILADWQRLGLIHRDNDGKIVITAALSKVAVQL